MGPVRFVDEIYKAINIVSDEEVKVPATFSAFAESLNSLPTSLSMRQVSEEKPVPKVLYIISKEFGTVDLARLQDITQKVEQLHHYIEENFPNLNLGDEFYYEKLLDFLSLGPDIEVDSFFAPLLEDGFFNYALERLNGKGSITDNHKKVILELVCSSVLVPVRIQKIEKHRLLKQSVEPLPPDRIRFWLQTGLEGLESLEGLVKQEGLGKKLFTLSLLDWEDDEFYEQVTEDPLVEAVKANEWVDWMLAASGSREQVFLNSCTAAALFQNMMHLAGSIQLFLIVWEGEFEALREALEEAEESDAVMQQMDQLDQAVQELREDLENGSISPEEASLQLNRAFQRFSLIADAEETQLPLPKSIQNHWHLSAILVFFYCLAMLFSGHLSKKHFKGKDPEDLLEVVPFSVSVPSYENIDSASYKKAKNNNVYLNNMWIELYTKQGIVLKKPHHSLFCEATLIDGERVFLLSDPMRDDYKKLNFEEMGRYLKRHKLD